MEQPTERGSTVNRMPLVCMNLLRGTLKPNYAAHLLLLLAQGTTTSGCLHVYCPLKQDLPERHVCHSAAADPVPQRRWLCQDKLAR